ncbi:hypothetical protein C4559_00310 [Candidatus Microgenomates bacterium]|nr:MAG: hypothetical protein C4559_00310 [Candidatus Microgenomates bacterium]
MYKETGYAIKQTPEWISFHYGKKEQRARLETVIEGIKETGHCSGEWQIIAFEVLSRDRSAGLNSFQRESLKKAEIMLQNLFGPDFINVVEAWRGTQSYRERQVRGNLFQANS